MEAREGEGVWRLWGYRLLAAGIFFYGLMGIDRHDEQHQPGLSGDIHLGTGLSGPVLKGGDIS